MKYFILILVLVIVAAGGFYGYVRLSVPGPSVTAGSRDATLAPEVEAVLARKTLLAESVAQNPTIVAEVAASNEKNKTLSKSDIERLDKEWQSSAGLTPFIRLFLENQTAKILLSFQREHPSFKEVFIADAYGLNVGQTDKTSDYYQADESWWVDSFAGGVGKILHGKIEFDQSAQSEAISIYVPIMDAGGKNTIGVLKGVLDLAAIKKEL